MPDDSHPRPSPFRSSGRTIVIGLLTAAPLAITWWIVSFLFEQLSSLGKPWVFAASVGAAPALSAARRLHAELDGAVGLRGARRARLSLRPRLGGRAGDRPAADRAVRILYRRDSLRRPDLPRNQALPRRRRHDAAERAPRRADRLPLARDEDHRPGDADHARQQYRRGAGGDLRADRAQPDLGLYRDRAPEVRHLHRLDLRPGDVLHRHRRLERAGHDRLHPQDKREE